MDDPSKEAIERGEQLLRESGIDHEVRLVNGRSAESEKSAESKKKVHEDRRTHSVEKASGEARKGSRGKDKIGPLSTVSRRVFLSAGKRVATFTLDKKTYAPPPHRSLSGKEETI